MFFLLLLLACIGTPSGTRTDEPTSSPSNRLATASSPYLRQHADNPVHWFPWGEEAFAEAARRDVPVFLSIGYAACHWCHVMEHESFEDPEVAAFLNAHFVSVKVDREERPDVDALYMQAVFAFTGRGGWPASLWLTPDRRPLYAGTYFPPQPGAGRPSFLQVLQEIDAQWRGSRATSLQLAAEVEQHLRARAVPPPGASVPEGAPARGVVELRGRWDAEHGGWGTSSKFPNSPTLELYLALAADQGLQAETRQVLDAMESGGLHDHIGGGFHRYTVDRAWTIPHFEKMTYDNAQLLGIYAEAARVLGEPRYEAVARDTADWLLREMRAEDGTFFSSVDADSEGGEGAFYTWVPSEIEAALSEQQAALFLASYAVTEQGNLGGRTVLSRTAPDSPDLLEARLALRAARATRPAPLIDTKRVTAYNGLVISGLARAGRLLREPRYVEAAGRAARALIAARRPDGGLPRTLAPDAPLAVLDDYAFLAEGLLDLYEADLDPAWLRAADELAGQIRVRFSDPLTGALFLADSATDDLLVRQVDFTDGARPSGAGRAVQVLWRLRCLGAPHGDAEAVQRALEASSSLLAHTPGSAPTLLQVIDGLERGSIEVVLAGSETAAFTTLYDETPRPRSVLARVDPALHDFSAVAGKHDGGLPARAYVCFDGVCDQPTADLERFRTLLDRGGRGR